jgi:hypothetical protein
MARCVIASAILAIMARNVIASESEATQLELKEEARWKRSAS